MTYRNTLLEMAEREAMQGTEALRRFWGRQNADGRKLLAPDKEDLKRKALFADVAAAQELKEREL